MMTRALRRWQEETRQERLPEISAARSRQASWLAQRDGILAKIKKLAGSRKDVDEADRRTLESDLAVLDRECPGIPRESRLFLEDVTPEKMAEDLALGWPSSSLWSDEGGLIVGSHAMSDDSVMRFLALINRLWDGGTFEQRRTTRESVRVAGRRLHWRTYLRLVEEAEFAELAADAGFALAMLERWSRID